MTTAFHYAVHGIHHEWLHWVHHEAHGDMARFLFLRCLGVLGSSLLCGILTTFVVPECSGGGVL